MFEIINICNGGGYKYCKTIPIHPKANSKGLYPLHRVLMENKIGRLLEENEVVHHIDFNKTNNNIDNLQILSNEEHSRIHKIKDFIKCKCGWCGKEFEIKKHHFNLRIKRSNENKIFCSRKCGTLNHYNKTAG